MNCHFTRAKLLSMSISRKYASKATATPSRMESGLPQTKKMPTHPRNSTFSTQCITSTSASVEPDISVVMPRTIS